MSHDPLPPCPTRAVLGMRDLRISPFLFNYASNPYIMSGSVIMEDARVTTNVSRTSSRDIRSNKPRVCRDESMSPVSPSNLAALFFLRTKLSPHPWSVRDQMDHCERMNLETERALRSGLDGVDKVCLLITGSRAEGLSSGQSGEPQSDLDVMVVMPFMGSGMTQLDMHNTPSGYARIKTISRMNWPKGVVSDDNFVTSDLSAWKRQLQANYRLALGNVDIHGPALRTQNQHELQVDYVTTLVLPTKLPQISAWVERKRFSSWPPEDVINRIACLPTLVVPVGHHASKERCKEWRLSYSQAELELSRTIGYVPRTSYILFKNTVRAKLSDSGHIGLRSYHLKTTLLWTLEEHGNENHNEDELRNLLMKKLISSIQERSIPHYFNPQINLIDSLTDDHISEATKILTPLLHVSHSSKQPGCNPPLVVGHPHKEAVRKSKTVRKNTQIRKATTEWFKRPHRTT